MSKKKFHESIVLAVLACFVATVLLLWFLGREGVAKSDMVADKLKDLGAGVLTEPRGRASLCGVIEGGLFEVSDVVNVSFWTHRIVRDETLEMLAFTPEIRRLVFSESGITDQGIEIISRLDLKKLVSLEIDSTSITDRSIELIGGMGALKELAVSGCCVTDASVRHIAAMVELKFLDIRDTDITADGVQSLVLKRPDIEVVW